MKIVNVIIGLVLLLVSMLMMESLMIKPTTTQITVLWDVTDTAIGKPVGDEIMRLYNLDGSDMWNGGKFRLSTLSNVNFNPSHELDLPARNKWLSNELQRQKEIQSFKSKISFLMDAPQMNSLGMPNSSIYWPLMSELKRLSEQTGDRRVIVVQSDLMEHNFDLSLYDPKQLKSFTANPASAAYLTDNISQMGSLSGIEVYLLYQPKDAKDSQRYTLISEVLKNLLQEKGAKVFRSANLNR